MKTLIAVPCMDQVAAPFAQSLATMNRIGECYVSFLIGSLIYESRNNLAKQAIKVGADYVLWLDSDMIFPTDTMEKMLKHMEEGKDIVSGLYFRRRNPFTPVLFKKLNAEDGSWEGYDDYPQNSTFEVEGVGFGCCMTRTSALQDLFLNYQTCFNPITAFGEDLSFCTRAREMGYKVYADSSISCGHIGQIIVNEMVYLADKERK